MEMEKNTNNIKHTGILMVMKFYILLVIMVDTWLYTFCRNYRTVRHRASAKVHYSFQLKDISIIVHQSLIQDVNKLEVCMTVESVWELCTNCLKKSFKIEKVKQKAASIIL